MGAGEREMKEGDREVWVGMEEMEERKEEERARNGVVGKNHGEEEEDRR